MEHNAEAIAGVPAAIPLGDLRTIDELVEKFPRLLTKGTLQWQLRHRDANGLKSAVVMLGKRMLISQPLYEQWLATRRLAA